MNFRTNSSFGCGRIGRLLVARIVRVAQEAGGFEQAKAGRLDLGADERLLDPVQRARFRDAGAGPAGMVGDHVDAAGLERREHGAVHPLPVDAHVAEVVVVEHEGDEIDAAVRHLGRHRRLERLRDEPDADEGGLGQPRDQPGRRRARHLRIDASARMHRPRQQLGGVAAAGDEVDGDDALAHRDEVEHLRGLAPDVVGPVGGTAVGVGDDLLEACLPFEDRDVGAAGAAGDDGQDDERPQQAVGEPAPARGRDRAHSLNPP